MIKFLVTERIYAVLFVLLFELLVDGSSYIYSADIEILIKDYCRGFNCKRVTTNGSLEEICCNDFELRDGICTECEIGFYSRGGIPCYQCPTPYYGHRCRYICECGTTERCHHKVGCVQVLLSTEAVTTDDHVEGTDVMSLSILQIVNISIVSILFLLLVCVSLTYVCWKYEISCKKRERSTVQSSTIHTNRSPNHAHQGEAHEYIEVDDGRLNRGSAIYYIHRERNSGSSTRGSGICGVDSDGYLNPYHALKSSEIEMEYA